MHYDAVRPGHRFVRASREGLIEDDGERIVREHLVPLISGIGLGRRPVPPWARRGAVHAQIYRLGRALGRTRPGRRLRDARLLRSAALARPMGWLRRRLLGDPGR
jgi:hypothetical protein